MLATGDGRGASASTLKRKPASSSSATPTNNSPLLRYGMRGSQVKRLQRSLNQAGYNAGNVDGIFGNGTQTALKKFQKAQGLTQDGIAGNNTWSALNNYHPSSVAKSHASHQIKSAFSSQPKAAPKPKKATPLPGANEMQNLLNSAPENQVSPSKSVSNQFNNMPGGLNYSASNQASPVYKATNPVKAPTAPPVTSQFNNMPGGLNYSPSNANSPANKATAPTSPILKKSASTPSLNNVQSQFNNLPGGLNYNPQNPYPYASQLPNTTTNALNNSLTTQNQNYTNPLTSPLQQLANASGTPSTTSGLPNNGLPSGFGNASTPAQQNNGLPSGFGSGGFIGGSTPTGTALGNSSGLSASQLQQIQNMAPVTSATNDQNGTTGDLQKKWLQLMNQAQSGNISNDAVLNSEIDAAKQAANSKYFQQFLKNRSTLAEHGMGNSGFVNDALVRSQLGEQQAIAKALPTLINDRQNQILKQASEYGTMYKDMLPYQQMTAAQQATNARDMLSMEQKQLNQAGLADVNGQLTPTISAQKMQNQVQHWNQTMAIDKAKLTLSQQKFNEQIKKDNASIAQGWQRISDTQANTQNTADSHLLTAYNDARILAGNKMASLLKYNASASQPGNKDYAQYQTYLKQYNAAMAGIDGYIQSQASGSSPGN